MSSLYGCAGGPGVTRYFQSFEDIPESEFYDDIDDSMLFVPVFPFDEMEVD